MTGWLWTLVTILGPLLLIGFIIWATVRNRRAGRGSVERAEQGAEDLREEIRRDPDYGP